MDILRSGRGRAVFAVAAVLLFGAVPRAEARVKKGEVAPELDGAKDLAGKPFQLREYRGRWVVLTFGASWCKPCKKELVAWDKLAVKWAGKVTFVALNLDNDPAEGKKFMERLKLRTMRQAFAPESTVAVADIYEPPTQPTTYLIDPKGLVRELHEGFVAGDEAKLDRRLVALVK